MCHCTAEEACNTCEGLTAIAAKPLAPSPVFSPNPSQPHALLRLSISELTELWERPLSDALAAKVGTARRALMRAAGVELDAMDPEAVYAAIDAARRAAT